MAQHPALPGDVGKGGLSAESGGRPGLAPAGPGSGALKVVICGEVSSGKSTLLNILLRSRVLPDNLGATRRPPVTVISGASGGTERRRRDAHLLTLVNTAEALREAGAIEIRTDLAHLDGVELTELPLTTAAALTSAQRATIGAADALIWVTIGPQAWRVTERKIMDELRQVRPSRGLIVISRADKLRPGGDREKIIARVRREAVGYFSEVLFLGAARQVLDQLKDSEDIWTATGGPELLVRILAWRDELRLPTAAKMADSPDAPTARA